MAGICWGSGRIEEKKRAPGRRAFFVIDIPRITMYTKGIVILGMSPGQEVPDGKKQTMDHAQLLVLSLLAGEDMYGYQMIVELARRSDHTFEMKEGTLYPVLHGLERDGAVEAYQQEAPTGRMRKYYRLTRRGAAVLREEAAAWQTYSGAVNAVLRACPGLDPA